MARLSILSNDELKALYNLPSLNDEERIYVFELDNEDRAYIEALNEIDQKINYILQLGYYRTVSYFFRFTFQQVKDDVQFILHHYFPMDSFPKKNISKHIHYKNLLQICQRFKIKESTKTFLLQLEKEAKRLTTLHMLPKFVLTGLLTFCQQKCFIKPAYSTLQDIISRALKAEKNRLSNKLYTSIQKEFRDQLDNLLNKEDFIYSLTLLKKEQLNFSTTEIKQTIEKQKSISDVYIESQQLVKILGISEQNIIYYSELAQFYTIQKLKNFKSKNQARLYLLCYISHRFRQINDQLIASFLQKMLMYQKLGDDYQQKQIEAVESADKKLRNQAHKIMLINVNKKIPDSQVREKAFEIVPKFEYRRFLSDFKKPNFARDFYRWEYYGQLAQKIKRNLRPLFRALQFSCEIEGLDNALKFLQKYIDGNKSFYDYTTDEIPLDFFPKTLKRFIMTKSPIDRKRIVDIDRYEFMVYWQLQKGINDISVHIKDSYSHRALEDELIDIEYWETHKNQLIKELNMPIFSRNIVDILTQLEDSIETKYQEVNRRIIAGENTCIKLKHNSRRHTASWTLPYTPLDDGTDNPFFKKLPTFNISDIAEFVHDTTGYGKAFTHIQPNYAKESPEMELINACVIANATGTEMAKMMEISDVDGQSLKNTQQNFIRPQTLSEASDIIINHTERLPIFEEYNLSDYGVHASVDGQKFTTRFNTIKSRYAKKYFGLKKGVVVMTLNANMLPICLKVIGANEHESHYLLDLVESNRSGVNITAVSGDMHSINRVNFALMYMFGYRFMPRFTQLTNTTSQQLVCFGSLSDYGEYIISPSKKAQKHQIISEWDKVLRILVSLALKKTTQATVVRKLSTTKSSNSTLKALIAFDEIIMTDYLLGYIDDQDQRIAVQRSLNRGESYHQLTASIAKVNGGKQLSGKKERNLIINAECIRLIANMIIYHNAAILSALYEYYTAKDPEKSLEIIHWSPVAWRFVNLIGNYEFYRKDKIINIHKVIDKLITDFEIDFLRESIE